MATGSKKSSGFDVARSAVSGAKRTKSNGDGTAVTKTAVARSVATSAATSAAKKGARQVVVHAATKNPYVLGVVAVLVVLLLCVGIAVVALPTTSEPNLLALQLSVANNDPQMPGGGTADIPPIVYSAYVRASGRSTEIDPNCIMRPAILAGIGWQETRHGTYRGAVADAYGDIAPPIIGIPLNGTNGTAAISDTDGGAMDNDTVWDRAVGPMQFIPSSWEIFGQDGNDDGFNNPHNIFDAALAAVDHLCSASPTDMNESEEALRAAIFSYNRSTSYVDAVMSRIAYYDTALGIGGNFSADPALLLSNPNFTACDMAIGDLNNGIVDGRLITLLSMITQTHSLYICTFKTGHSQCIGGGSLVSDPGCSESNHWHGRAADIIVVDGTAVHPNHAGARAIIEWLTTFSVDDVLYPDDIGSPWSEFDPLPAFYSDANHAGHLHIGMCGPRWREGRFEDTCA